MLMKCYPALIVLLVLAAQEATLGQSTGEVKAEFKFEPANAAVGRFHKRLEFLTKKMQEAIEAAGKELKNELESAAAAAFQEKQFGEAKHF